MFKLESDNVANFTNSAFIYSSAIDHCYDDPCLNNGSCINSPNGYNCTCPSEFTGVNCEGKNYYYYFFVLTSEFDQNEIYISM